MAFNLTLRKVYLYLFAIVGLVLIITGGISLIDLGLKATIFKQADDYPIMIEKRIPTKDGQDRELTAEEQAERKAEAEETQRKQRTSERQRQASRAIAQLIVGVPLFAYHWRLIRKEQQV